MCSSDLPLSSEEAVCFTHREKSHAKDYFIGGDGPRVRGRRNFRGRGGRQSQTEKYNLRFIRCNKEFHDASTCKFPWDKIEHQRNQEKGKNHDGDKGKAPKSTDYFVAHCNNGVTEDLFDVSFTWRNDWLLD